jgi:hypothetical protein
MTLQGAAPGGTGDQRGFGPFLFASTDMSFSRPLPLLAALLAIVAWMLLAHPYEGVRHDGTLYLGQALLNSRVPALAHDVFFVGGSQDRYSIYSHLMVRLYEHLGLLRTHVGVMLSSWALMLGAVLTLLRRFAPEGSLALWGALGFAVMSPIYGGSWVFGYSENFVTARSFAEPLLLWALAALLAGRRRVAVALQVAGALFHPLMSLPVITISWCFLAETDRRWLWLLAAVPAALLAALGGIAPWDGLLKTYDPYWWALVETGNEQVLLSNWSLQDKLSVVLDLAVLLAISRLRPLDDATRMLYATVVTTVVFIALSALGADGWHAVLLTQLQLWRAHWVAHLLAMALAPWLLAQLWQRGGLWPASACALALALLNSHIGMNHGSAALALWALASLAAWRVRTVSRPMLQLACGGILFVVLGLGADQMAGEWRQLTWESPSTLWSDGLFKLAAFPLVAAAGFAGLLRWAERSRAHALTAVALGAILLGATVSHWDQRPDLARAIESTAPGHLPFGDHIPPDASVYWPEQLAHVWSLLERPSHFSKQQGAGVLFNRYTGLVFGPREEQYRRINEDRERCRNGAMLTRDIAAKRACEMPSMDRLTTLCNQPDAPDFLVLRGRLEPPPLATWQPPTRRDPPQTFALYACDQLRPAHAL